MTRQLIKTGKRYKYTSDMIRIAIKTGYKHVAGRGFACKKCGCKNSVRKFLKGKDILYACNKCGSRWGDLPNN